MDIKCKGENCKAVNGVGHSEGCIEELNIAYDTPGNRNPAARYRGYKNEPLDDGSTNDEKSAWAEGRRARVESK